MMVRLRLLAAAHLIAGLIAGLVVLSGLEGGAAMAQEPAYFSDPKSAVAEAAKLLRAEAWAELARYYDLSGTTVPPDTLTSGSFFVRDKPPAVGHPAGFDRYKQPFAPGFSYMTHTSAGDDEVKVTVDIEIDQGGGMIQRGMDTFYLRRSVHGYQLLPNSPDRPADPVPTPPAIVK